MSTQAAVIGGGPFFCHLLEETHASSCWKGDRCALGTYIFRLRGGPRKRPLGRA